MTTSESSISSLRPGMCCATRIQGTDKIPPTGRLQRPWRQGEPPEFLSPERVEASNDVGSAPGLIYGGCHGPDEKEVFAELNLGAVKVGAS